LLYSSLASPSLSIMPMVGSIGAVSASQRAARRRQGTTTSMASKRTPTPATRSQASDTASNASVESKSSVLSMLKQQVQETGGFMKHQVQETGGLFKRKQQFLVDKVQKGFQMASGTTSENKPAPCTASEQKQPKIAAKPEEEKVKTPAVDPAAQKKAKLIETLEQMGFERSHIQEAMTRLGGKAKQAEDVVQELVAMAAKAEKSCPGGSSSSDSFVVKLTKSRGQRLGLAVDVSEPFNYPYGLVVGEVTEGLVANWNAANPKLQVLPGASILEVNGTRGKPRQLLDLMQRDSSITMLIQPSRKSRKVPLAAASSSTMAGSSSASSGASSASGSTSSQGKSMLECLQHNAEQQRRVTLEEAAHVPNNMPPATPPTAPAAAQYLCKATEKVDHVAYYSSFVLVKPSADFLSNFHSRGHWKEAPRTSEATTGNLETVLADASNGTRLEALRSKMRKTLVDGFCNGKVEQFFATKAQEVFEQGMKAQHASGWIEGASLEKTPEIFQVAAVAKKAVDDRQASPMQGGA